MQLRRLWSGSTLLRVASVLGVITLIVIAVVLTAAVFTERSTGKGAAINVAGSLRMQSYLLATRVADTRATPEAQRIAIESEIRGFETRLTSPRLTEALPADPADPLRASYQRIEQRWQVLKPLAHAAAADAGAQSEFLERVHPFVADVDRLVLQLEADLESRIHGLQVALGAALFVILVLVLTAIFVLDFQVFQPIKDLVLCAQRVRAGDFGVRAQRDGDDELGQLGRGFNHMVEELGRLYGSLEAQIAAKTADLAQKNQSLSLLYETARELAVPQVDPATLQRVAERVRRVLGVQAAVVCARHPGTQGGFPLAFAEEKPGALCDEVGCRGCLDEAKVVLHESADGQRRVVVVPLLDGDRQYGVLPLQLGPGQALDPWQLELAQTVARHVGAALAAAEAREEHRRLALFEERSAIARELHDSLAQSLSYTKIQLARLSALLAAQRDGKAATNGYGHAAQAAEGHAGSGVDSGANDEAGSVLKDLREGVSSAYRQLRELLTTFRLQLSGKGLAPALGEAVAEFTARTGIETELRNELVGIELSANQQIHVLQIVREALANIEHHSRARHAWVRLTSSGRGDAAAEVAGSRQIEVDIEDDGVGIASLESPRQHFGLLIMRDRAQLVGGSIDVAQRPEGGTRVCLRFGVDAPYGGRAEPRTADTADGGAAARSELNVG